MKNLRRRNECRLCGSSELEMVLPIQPSPIADAFITKDLLDEVQDLYPLDCYLCLDCGHFQNIDVVDPDVLFRDYTYRTSVSAGLVEHFGAYSESVIEKLQIAEGSLVIEIGSNDGSLLRAFKARGMRVLGVDPAREIANEATKSGILTLPEFFSYHVAAEIRTRYGLADLFCANNVFAHIDNLSEVARGISEVLAPGGVFIFEVSYLMDMVDNMVFDTIYHEHVSYHLLQPLEGFFNRHNLTIFDVNRVETKGGSIRVFVQKLAAGRYQRSCSLNSLLAEEKRRGFLDVGIYKKWFERIEMRKRDVLTYLDAATLRGKIIAGYGASSTTTTLTYHFGLDSRLSFIVDDNLLKQGTFSPRAHIPVFASTALYDRKPDIVVVLSWIYADRIISRHTRFIEEGGIFLIPFPELKIISR
jgi:SAM-dependent methyltransferase